MCGCRGASCVQMCCGCLVCDCEHWACRSPCDTALEVLIGVMTSLWQRWAFDTIRMELLPVIAVKLIRGLLLSWSILLFNAFNVTFLLLLRKFLKGSRSAALLHMLQLLVSSLQSGPGEKLCGFYEECCWLCGKQLHTTVGGIPCDPPSLFPERAQTLKVAPQLLCVLLRFLQVSVVKKCLKLLFIPKTKKCFLWIMNEYQRMFERAQIQMSAALHVGAHSIENNLQDESSISTKQAEDHETALLWNSSELSCLHMWTWFTQITLKENDDQDTSPTQCPEGPGWETIQNFKENIQTKPWPMKI